MESFENMKGQGHSKELWISLVLKSGRKLNQSHGGSLQAPICKYILNKYWFENI